MSSKGNKTTAKTPRTVVRFKFGPDVRPHMVAEFKRVRGLPQLPELHPTPGLIAKRVRSFLQTVNEVVPPGTTVSVWPAIDMATTLAHVAPDRFGATSGVSYTLERGANIVGGKTLIRADGSGFDIMVGADWFVNRREDSPDDVEGKSTVLAHLAAHEPQHIVLTLAGLDSGDVVEAAQGDSPTVNDLLPGIAEAVNEYQCELAANRIIVSSFPHDAEAVAGDLQTFRESLAASVARQSIDRYQACSTVLAATKELFKGVAYAAAYRFYSGGDRSAPEPKPEQWDRYMSVLWSDLLDMYATIPAAGDQVDKSSLAQTVFQMTELELRWLEHIGVRYAVEIEDEEWVRSCWWAVPEPV